MTTPAGIRSTAGISTLPARSDLPTAYAVGLKTVCMTEVPA